MLEIGTIIFRLVLAALVGGLFGIEREFKHKAAGLQTNILVALGSTLTMIVSVQFDIDPARIAAGVVTGIGFLGAGLIIHGRSDIQGITTAATIWLVSAIGLAIGIGYYSAAIVSAVIALVVFYFLSSYTIENWSIFKNRK